MAEEIVNAAPLEDRKKWLSKIKDKIIIMSNSLLRSYLNISV